LYRRGFVEIGMARSGGMGYAMADADERPLDEIVARNGAGKCGEVVEGKDLQGRHRPASGGVLVGEEELLPKIETKGNASYEAKDR
jgi:hypothetical protein